MMRIVMVLLVAALSVNAFELFGLFTKAKPKETVSLVLGSGGARGYAHIGVIEELEKRGLKIKSVAGSSMGALVGGLYAAGKLEEYKAWVLTLGFSDIMNLVSLTPESGGMINADRVFDKIYSLIGDVKIEELPIKYTAIATNITTRKEVRFSNGRLIDAIRASIAIPTVFLPVKKGDELLVDGGILNPLPLSVVQNDGSDYIIAVDVAAAIPNRYHISIPPPMQQKQKGIYDAIFAFFTQKTPALKKDEEGIMSVVRQTLDTAQDDLTRRLLRENRCDKLIEISRDSCAFYEFHRAYELIRIGQLAAIKALKNL